MTQRERERGSTEPRTHRRIALCPFPWREEFETTLVLRLVGGVMRVGTGLGGKMEPRVVQHGLGGLYVKFHKILYQL